MSTNPTSTRPSTFRLGRYQFSRDLFLRNWAIMFVFAVVAIALFNGRNVTTGEFDFGRGIGTVTAAFGGLASFGALVGAVFAVLFAFWGLSYMTRHQYTQAEEGRRQMHIMIGLAVLVAAAFVGVKWISLPAGAGWIALVFLGLVSVATALVTTHTIVLRPTTTP